MEKEKIRNFFSQLYSKNQNYKKIKSSIQIQENNDKNIFLEKKFNFFYQQKKQNILSKNFFKNLRKTVSDFNKKDLKGKYINVIYNKKTNLTLFKALEEHLLSADVGIKTTKNIINNLINKKYDQINNIENFYHSICKEMTEMLINIDKPLIISKNKPFIILIIGVNGVGKTTTTVKLAHSYQTIGKKVLLAAGDTFRAAAIEQLQIWGKQNNIPVISQNIGADAASVIFDAIQAAKARNIDIVIADTAGRLENKLFLMEELKKIIKVIKKLDVSAPHEIMLIIDAHTGQNAINQINLFNQTTKLTGITITKLDSTAKGGIIFAISNYFNIPIRYICFGENIEDLEPFKANSFVKSLLT